MANDKPAAPDARTGADLDRAVRAICNHFHTDEVIIIGSQAILVHDPDASAIMRTSHEIDAYPSNIIEWESSHLRPAPSMNRNLLI